MASSKNSKTEHQSEAADSSKPANKAAEPRKEKHLDKKNKSIKKKKLNNLDENKDDKAIVTPSSSTESHEKFEDDERLEDKTEITNGRTSAIKPKKNKVKGIKYDEAEGKGDPKASVVSNQSRYDFLSDFVPEKIKAEDASRERNSSVNGG